MDASQRARILDWNNKEDGERRRYSFFVLKNLKRSLSVPSSSWSHSVSNRRRIQQDDDQEEEEEGALSIWKMFTSLQIDSKQKVTDQQQQQQQQHGNGDDDSSGYSAKVLDVIGQIMAREILLQFQQDSLAVSFMRSSDEKKKNEHVNGDNKGGRVSHLSKHFYRSVSHAIKSVMASWDLVDDHWTSTTTATTTSSSTLQNQDEDEDDAIRNPNGMLSDVDDANINSQDLNKMRTCNNHAQTDETLTPDDVLWNTNLFVQCWDCIVQYAQSIIQQDQDPTNKYTVTVVQDPEICSGLGPSSTKGILLHRHGEEPFSFVSFCREAGDWRIGDRSSYSSRSTQSREKVGITMIGNLLQNLTQGLTLEILLSSLVQTNKARMVKNCQEKDIVVLFPSAYTTSVHSWTTGESTVFQVNKVDIAIFQITCAIHGLERRVEQMEQQVEVAYEKATEAKQRRNIPVALLHLKRRKMFQREIETCMGSLVNLETGLHTIKRTKDDVELVKTYNLMNESLKAVRKETSLEQVEELMQELEENTLDLNDIHNELHYCHSIKDNLSLNVQEEQELEQELNKIFVTDGNMDKGEQGHSSAKTKERKMISIPGNNILELYVEGRDTSPKEEEGKEESSAETNKSSTLMAII